MDREAGSKRQPSFHPRETRNGLDYIERHKPDIPTLEQPSRPVSQAGNQYLNSLPVVSSSSHHVALDASDREAERFSPASHIRDLGPLSRCPAQPLGKRFRHDRQEGRNKGEESEGEKEGTTRSVKMQRMDTKAAANKDEMHGNVIRNASHNEGKLTWSAPSDSSVLGPLGAFPIQFLESNLRNNRKENEEAKETVRAAEVQVMAQKEPAYGWHIGVERPCTLNMLVEALEAEPVYEWHIGVERPCTLNMLIEALEAEFSTNTGPTTNKNTKSPFSHETPILTENSTLPSESASKSDSVSEANSASKKMEGVTPTNAEIGSPTLSNTQPNTSTASNPVSAPPSAESGSSHPSPHFSRSRSSSSESKAQSDSSASFSSSESESGSEFELESDLSDLAAGDEEVDEDMYMEDFIEPDVDSNGDDEDYDGDDDGDYDSE